MQVIFYEMFLVIRAIVQAQTQVLIRVPIQDLQNHQQAVLPVQAAAEALMPQPGSFKKMPINFIVWMPA